MNGVLDLCVCSKKYLTVCLFPSGYTAVMVAADQGDSEALKLLLEAGANINCRVSILSTVTTITYSGLVWLTQLSIEGIFSNLTQTFED